MNKLTPEQKENYLKHGASFCPYCESGNIGGTDDGFEWNEPITRILCCEDCNKEWVDTLTVISVEGTEE